MSIDVFSIIRNTGRNKKKQRDSASAWVLLLFNYLLHFLSYFLFKCTWRKGNL